MSPPRVHPSGLKIKEEYSRLVPKPSREDYERLKISIAQQGLYEPIRVNSEGIVLDGYTRFQICRELGIELADKDILVKQFPSSILEKRYVIVTNLARRHMNDFQKAELGIPLLEIEEQLAKDRQLELGKKLGATHGIFSPTPLAPNGAERMDETIPAKATEITAREIGLKTRTFEKAKAIIQHAPEELKERVRGGKVSISYAYGVVSRANPVRRQGKSVAEIPDDIAVPMRNTMRAIIRVQKQFRKVNPQIEKDMREKPELSVPLVKASQALLGKVPVLQCPHCGVNPTEVVWKCCQGGFKTEG